MVAIFNPSGFTANNLLNNLFGETYMDAKNFEDFPTLSFNIGGQNFEFTYEDHVIKTKRQPLKSLIEYLPGYESHNITLGHNFLHRYCVAWSQNKQGKYQVGLATYKLAKIIHSFFNVFSLYVVYIVVTY